MTELSLDIRYGSDLHTQVLDLLNKRYQYSADRMTNEHSKWRQAEDQFIAYAPEREVDAIRRNERENSGKPQYTTIVLPYTYGMLMSAHSYWTTVFMSRSPVFQFSGRHGEAEQQTQAVEALIDYQMQVGEMVVPLYFWLLDAGKFGIAYIGNYWDEQITTISSMQEQPKTFLGIPYGSGGQKKLVTQDIRGYYGNKLFNIRPYDAYPDPRVPLWNVQAGEFFAYAADASWLSIARRGATGQYMNVDALKKKRSAFGGQSARSEGSTTQPLPNSDQYTMNPSDLRETGPFALVTMYVDLVPSEWGLSDSSKGEKWVFTCACMGRKPANNSGGNLEMILEARPLGCLHNRFPVFAQQFEPEAYAFASRSLPEVIRPIQNTMDWLLNSHMYNVRKTMNNQFLIDPSKIILQSVEDSMAGGSIMLRPGAYGTDVRSAISQLQVSDVTRGHMMDMGYFHELAQRTTGVNDQIMGMVNQGGRKTAQEIRTSSTFGINRQKTVVELYSAMAWGPLGQVLLQNSQQYFDAELKLKIVGDLAQMAGPQFLSVTPELISGFYDFVPVDGTLPVDRFAQANLWKEILAGLRNMPEILQQYDTGKIFAWVAQLAGLKNIQQFKVQIMPPGQAEAAAQAGNVVPLAKAQQDLTRVGEPGQIPNMGATG